MVWYGVVNVDLYRAIITKVSNALNTLVSGEKPGFQAQSKGLIVLLCAEVIRQGVPDHGAMHRECSASNKHSCRIGTIFPRQSVPPLVQDSHYSSRIRRLIILT